MACRCLSTYFLVCARKVAPLRQLIGARKMVPLRQSIGVCAPITNIAIPQSELKSAALMKRIKLHLTTDTGKRVAQKINLVYQINIAPKMIGFDEESYVVDLKKIEVKKGLYEDGKPDAIFSIQNDDFVKVATGKMNPQIAFMTGAMKIEGSISAVRKLTPDIFPNPSDM